MKPSGYHNQQTTTQRTALAGSGLDQRVLAFQTRFVFSQSLTGLFAELLAAGLVGLLLWTLTPRWAFNAWAITAAVILFVHMLVIVGFRSEDPAAARMKVWATRYTITSVVSGLLWGSAGMLTVIFGSPEQQILGAFILGSLSAIIFAVKSPLMLSLAGFLIPALGPSIGWLVLQGERFQVTTGIFAALLIILLLLAARKSQASLARLSKHALENTVLMKHLAMAKDEALAARRKSEKVNQDLQNEIGERKRAQEKIEASEKDLSGILNNIRDTIIRTDASGIITWASSSVREFLGYSPAEIVGMNLKDLYVDEDRYTRFREDLEKGFGLVNHHVAMMKRQDGNTAWGSTNAHYSHDRNGEIDGIEGIIRDISDYKRSQEDLFIEKGKAQTTLESIGDGVISTDVHGLVEYINPTAEVFTGWTNEDAVGLPIQTVLSIVDESTQKPLSENPAELSLREGRSVGLSEPALLKHRFRNSTFSIEVTAAPIRNTEQEMIGSVLVFHDVTKLRSLARQMSYQATHDALTGLINRREFEVQLKEMIDSADTSRKRHCVCYLDLDQFKIVNDTCGHLAGDQLLKEVTEKLNERLRESDTLARLGGDEFAILLKGCPLAKATEIAEDLRAVVDRYRLSWDGQQFRVGASIGVVPVTGDGTDITDILSAADSAMYVAKEGGRNRVHVFEPDDTAVAQRHGEMQWMQRIQSALDEDRFKLFLQKIIPLSDQPPHRIDGEVLLRMIDEEGELIAPRIFMPAAERYHLMPAIDRWVLSRVFETLRARQQAGMEPLAASINLSGQSFSNKNFLHFILDLLTESEISPELLCFEITETAVVANINSASALISELRGIGCRFALDDFGSGLSSFAYLKNLPIDFLKIDGSFISNMAGDSKDRSVVKAINEIGHVMGIMTIAEFVENERTLELLRSLHVDYAQGYGIGEPMPMEKPEPVSVPVLVKATR